MVGHTGGRFDSVRNECECRILFGHGVPFSFRMVHLSTILIPLFFEPPRSAREFATGMSRDMDLLRGDVGLFERTYEPIP